MEVAPWALIHDTRRRMSHTACVSPWTVFIMSKERKGSPLTRVTLRGPCKGSTGKATLSPSSRCSLAVCEPDEVHERVAHANPWTHTTHGRGPPR